MQRRWDFIPVVISSEFCLCLVFEPCSFIRKSSGEGGIDVDYRLLGFQLFLVKTQRGPCATTQKKRVLALVVFFEDKLPSRALSRSDSSGLGAT